MKKQDVTYEDKFNELILDCSHPNNKGKVFIFVEGDSDIRFFRKIFHPENCKIESIPGGNPKVEEATENILKRYALVLGIRDADFLHLDNPIPFKKNIFLTDYHDLEICQVALDEVFSSIMSEHSTLHSDEHIEIRDVIFKTINDISYLKWLNAIEGCEIKFSAGFQDLISFENKSIDFEEYFSRLMKKSPNAKYTDSNIVLEKLNFLKQRAPSDFHICNGHDFIKTLLAFLTKSGEKRLSEDVLSSSFRMLFTPMMWKTTKIFELTQKWAIENNCVIYT